MVVGWIVFGVIDTDDKCAVGILGRRGDNDLSSTGVDVHLRICCVGEAAGALNHDVNTQVAPG